ncbi:MAG: hypothetical protein AAF654_11300 [Myxococcota bacterium]
MAEISNGSGPRLLFDVTSREGDEVAFDPEGSAAQIQADGEVADILAPGETLSPTGVISTAKQAPVDPQPAPASSTRGWPLGDPGLTSMAALSAARRHLENPDGLSAQAFADAIRVDHRRLGPDELEEHRAALAALGRQHLASEGRNVELLDAVDLEIRRLDGLITPAGAEFIVPDFTGEFFLTPPDEPFDADVMMQRIDLSRFLHPQSTPLVAAQAEAIAIAVEQLQQFIAEHRDADNLITAPPGGHFPDIPADNLITAPPGGHFPDIPADNLITAPPVDRPPEQPPGKSRPPGLDQAEARAEADTVLSTIDQHLEGELSLDEFASRIRLSEPGRLDSASLARHVENLNERAQPFWELFARGALSPEGMDKIHALGAEIARLQELTER